MRELGAMLAVTGVALLVIAAGIRAGGDRALFVPGPESVVEDFMRMVATRRFDLAPKYLASGLARSESPQTLAGRFNPLFAATGTINRVEVEPRWMEGDRASATAIVEGDRGKVSYEFTLVRENRFWRIDWLPTPDSASVGARVTGR